MRTKQAKKLKVTTRERHLHWINHYVSNDFGIWIECTACKKWRKNYEYSESHEVPENWICSMGTLDNGERGKCEDPEENSEEKFLEYCPGSVVWARLDGYPWWPGMVDEDPDIEEYFWQNKSGSYFYNVTFLDENVTHAWVSANCMSPYLKPPHRNSCLQKQYKRNKYTNAIMKAEERAREALNMTLQERLKHFSFVYLYKGKWPLADNFEDDEENNPHDITDILLQEMDDLDSIDSFGTDDQEESVTPISEFLPSEKKIIQNGFDYLQKKNKGEHLNKMKYAFESVMQHKPNKNGGKSILKSIENIQTVKSFENKGCNDFIYKENTISDKKDKSATAKRSKNSSLSHKKFKTGNNCFKRRLNKEMKFKSAEKTSEGECELIDLSDQNDSETSVFPLNVDKLSENPLEEVTIEKEDISEDKDISEQNILNKVDSDITHPDKFNKISPMKDIAMNEIALEESISCEPNSCDPPIDKTKEDLQSNDLKLPDCLITEGSNNIAESAVKPLEIAISDQKDIGTFACHLDECITNVINNANLEIESSLSSVPSSKKKEKQIGESKCLVLENVSSKDGNPATSDVPKVNKKTTHASISEVNKQKKCKNIEIAPLKKKAKLVGYDKFKSNENVTYKNSKELKAAPINDSKAVAEVNGKLLKKNVDSIESSECKKDSNIPNSHKKTKPGFKTFKRPFKNPNANLLKNVINSKMRTQENVKEKFNAQANSSQLVNKDEMNLISDVEKSYSCVPVDGTNTNPSMARALEDTVIETNLGDFVSGNEKNNFKCSSIDDKNVEQDIKHKDEKKDTDDCFFYVPVSDEE